jgi:hypothetical protein
MYNGVMFNSLPPHNPAFVKIVEQNKPIMIQAETKANKADEQKKKPSSNKGNNDLRKMKLRDLSLPPNVKKTIIEKLKKPKGEHRGSGRATTDPVETK